MALLNLGTKQVFPSDNIEYYTPFTAQRASRYLLQFLITANEPNLVLSYFNFFFKADTDNETDLVNTIHGRYFVRNDVQSTYLEYSGIFANNSPCLIGVQRVLLLPNASTVAESNVQVWVDPANSERF